MNWFNKWGEQSPTFLTIKDGNKTRTVVIAEVIGDLALEYDDNGWEIYHVPTLTKFSKAVPSYFKDTGKNFTSHETIAVECYEYEKDALIRWMKKVQENYPISWQMLRLLTPDDYEDKAQHAKDILLNYCLSVKVE